MLGQSVHSLGAVHENPAQELSHFSCHTVPLENQLEGVFHRESWVYCRDSICGA